MTSQPSTCQPVSMLARRSTSATPPLNDCPGKLPCNAANHVNTPVMRTVTVRRKANRQRCHSGLNRVRPTAVGPVAQGCDRGTKATARCRGPVRPFLWQHHRSGGAPCSLCHHPCVRARPWAAAPVASAWPSPSPYPPSCPCRPRMRPRHARPPGRRERCTPAAIRPVKTARTTSPTGGRRATIQPPTAVPRAPGSRGHRRGLAAAAAVRHRPIRRRRAGDARQREARRQHVLAEAGVDVLGVEGIDQQRVARPRALGCGLWVERRRDAHRPRNDSLSSRSEHGTSSCDGRHQVCVRRRCRRREESASRSCQTDGGISRGLMGADVCRDRRRRRCSGRQSVRDQPGGYRVGDDAIAARRAMPVDVPVERR